MTFIFSMDGITAGLTWSSPGGTGTFACCVTGPSTLDTTTTPNGIHIISSLVTDNNPVSPTYQKAAQSQFPVDFENGHTAMAVKLNFSQYPLVVGGPTVTLTGQIVYTDGLTPTAATCTWTSDNTGAATVNSSTGVVTPVAAGMAVITCTETGGKTATLRITVRAVNKTYHYCDSPTAVCADFIAGRSHIRMSPFFSSPDLMNGPPTGQVGMRQALTTAGFNALTAGYCLPPNGYANFAAWKVDQDTAFAAQKAVLDAMPTFGMIRLGDAYARQPQPLGDNVNGPSASWSPRPLTYCEDQMKTAGFKALCLEFVDEIATGYGAQPLPLHKMTGGDIVDVASLAGTCNMKKTQVPGGTTIGTIVITDAGGTPGFPGTFSVTGGTVTSLSWPCSVPPGTYTISTDPNFVLAIFATLPVYGGNPPVPETVFSDIIALLNASSVSPSGRLPVEMPVAAMTGNSYIQKNWQGNPALSNGASLYVAGVGTNPISGTTVNNIRAAADNIFWGSNGNPFNDHYRAWQDSAPKGMLTGNAVGSFVEGAFPYTISTIANSVLTTTAANVAQPGDKIGIVNTSSSTFDAYALAGRILSPTSFEIFGPSTTTSCGAGGTVTINGVAYSIVTMFAGSYINVSSTLSSTISPGDHTVVSGTSGCDGTYAFYLYYGGVWVTGTNSFYPLKLFSGSATGGKVYVGDSYLNTKYNPARDTRLAIGGSVRTMITATPYMAGMGGGCCAAQLRTYSLDNPVPGADINITFPVIPFKRSDNSLTQVVATSGGCEATLAYAHPALRSGIIAIVGGPAGMATSQTGASTPSTTTVDWSCGGVADGTYTTAGMELDFNTFEAQSFALYNSANLTERLMWEAGGLGNNLLQILESHILQPYAGAPDYQNPTQGCLFSQAWTDSTANTLQLINTCEGMLTQAIDFTALQTGSDPIDEYRVTDAPSLQTSAASGSSETITFTPGMSVFLVFHKINTSDLRALPLSFGSRVALGAAKTYMRYEPQYPDLVDRSTDATDCTSGCTMHWPASLATYYRFYYTDSTGAVVYGRSDVQCSGAMCL
jgi:hypothetical protein